MSLPPLPLVEGALFVDNSMIELLTTCPRALEYNRFHKRISSASKPSLNFGSAIHLALEYRYRNYKNKEVDSTLLEAQVKVIEEYFNSIPPIEDDYRNLNWAVEIVRRYNERYSTEPFQLLTNKEGEVQVELSFALPLFEYPWYGQDCDTVLIPVIYTGRIDLPVLWDDSVYIIDHKTTSMLGPSFGNKAKMSAQQRGYCWAWEQITGQKVKGYCINAIRVKEPPLYLTQPDSPRKGKSTVESWWQESFVRSRHELQPNDLDDWKTNLISLIEEMLWHYSRDFMPQKTSWCDMYGGCQYLDVCGLAKEDRLTMLSSGLFTDNNWNPLKTPNENKLPESTKT